MKKVIYHLLSTTYTIYIKNSEVQKNDLIYYTFEDYNVVVKCVGELDVKVVWQDFEVAVDVSHFWLKWHRP